MDEGNIQLNISSAPNTNVHRDKIKISRADRMKRKRKDVNANTLTELGAAPALSDDVYTPSSPVKKPLRDAEDGRQQHHHRSASANKFSSLFRNNPEIPHVNVKEVDIIKEKVFSSNSFSSLDLHPYMVSNLEQRLGYKHMTSVQQAAIPPILQGADVLIKSQTGSGKTISYAVPIIQKLAVKSPKISRCTGTFAVIIVPTRELALQSLDTLQKLVNPFSWIVPGSIMGGEKRKSEKARIRKGMNVLVATPGRLLDHLENTHSFTLNTLQWLVIDEADRLLDMGFEKAVSNIIGLLDERQSDQRQTILLSATLSAGVERLAGMSLQSPVKINISNEADILSSRVKEAISTSDSETGKESFAMPENLHHNFMIVPSKLRLVTLLAFILLKCKYSSKRSKMVIFMSTQDGVEFHNQVLSAMLAKEDSESDNDNLQLFKLHGEMPQQERTKVFNEFCATKSGILLCTDVAARGLDFPYVRWIVQYNTPGSATDYIHRVGRSARAGSQGRALIFLVPSEAAYVGVLNDFKIRLEEMKMDNILQTLLLQSKDLPTLTKGQIPRTVQESATALQMKIETYICEGKDIRSSARKAYQSFIRAYATYPSHLKHIFHIKHLHLGHLAKSFGLQEAPTQIGGIVGKFAKMDGKKHKTKRLSKTIGLGVAHGRVTKKRPSVKSLLMSEHQSGLDGTTVKLQQHYRHKQKKKKTLKR